MALTARRPMAWTIPLRSAIPPTSWGVGDSAKTGDGCQHGHAGGGAVDEASGVRHAGGIDPGQAEAQANQRKVTSGRVFALTNRKKNTALPVQFKNMIRLLAYLWAMAAQKSRPTMMMTQVRDTSMAAKASLMMPVPWR